MGGNHVRHARKVCVWRVEARKDDVTPGQGEYVDASELWVPYPTLRTQGPVDVEFPYAGSVADETWHNVECVVVVVVVVYAEAGIGLGGQNEAGINCSRRPNTSNGRQTGWKRSIRRHLPQWLVMSASSAKSVGSFLSEYYRVQNTSIHTAHCQWPRPPAPRSSLLPRGWVTYLALQYLA
ncbi:hypothetical protein PHLCEN_2v10683 [Hermanssonia centrifuga]|uniref:Uncharacterized protein n=1 Tax=Hermanssonia centrifuga TaxID=98765 RepID=A0A2R6NLZ5_9APHY|nr:hypothetical protein PHLCEN_2v10683 [Hermanssonia centrifuga]